MTPTWPERQVAERLFEVVPGVWRVPVPTPFAVGEVNVYLVDGTAPVMVDAGLAGTRTRDCLREALAAAGRRVEDVATLLVTHSHVDHAGGAGDVHAASGCAVRAHERALASVRDVAGHFASYAPWFGRFLRRSGFSDETISRHAEMARALRFGSRGVPDPVAIGQGDEVDAGGRMLVAHESPGHASDHVSFLLAGEGVLFTGDHVLPEISPNPTLEAPRPGDAEKPRALLQFRESLPRIAALPVRVACPAHGLPFADLAGRCRELLDHQAGRVARVREILLASGPMTRKTLSREVFGEVKLWDVYLGLSEVAAAVEVLEADGLAIVEDGGAVDLVRAL